MCINALSVTVQEKGSVTVTGSVTVEVTVE